MMALKSIFEEGYFKEYFSTGVLQNMFLLYVFKICCVIEDII